MRRFGVWGRDLDGWAGGASRWAGGFDRKTGEPKAIWYWACEHWVPGSGTLSWASHDHGGARAPRHRPTNYYQRVGA